MNDLACDALKRLLLDMISPLRPVAGVTLAALTAAEWDWLIALAQEHRLEPLLHWQLKRRGMDGHVARDVRQHLAERFKAASLRALVFQQELLRLHRLLERAGVPHVALKGAYLAFHSYPHPGLRPLRDLDVLVPHELALATYQLLQDEGVERMPEHPGDPAATLHARIHLPPLRARASGVIVELHTLLTREADRPIGPVDAPAEREFWSRVRRAPLADAAIPVEGATDLLLHMIVHAVYDHQFNNGPLLLSDLAFLLERETIDWPLFWTLAAREDRTRGCVLALKMMAHYWGARPVAWPDGQADAAADVPVELAALLMLQQFEARRDVALDGAFARQPSRFARLGLLLARAIPPREEIAARYAVPARSWRVYGYYAVRWWGLATQRIPGYFRARRDASIQQDMLQLRVLKDWLACR